MHSRLLSTVLLAAAVAWPAPTAAADRAWDGGGDGTTWSDKNNWSDDTEPGAEDHAIIAAGTTVRLTANASVARLTLGGILDATGFKLSLGAGPSLVETTGVLILGAASPSTDALFFDGPLSVEGRLDWAGGQVNGNTYGQAPGNKVLTVAPGGTMRWLGDAARTLSAVLDNRGTVRWQAGATDVYQAYSQTNSGLFEIALATDAAFRGVGVSNLGPWTWTNTGNVRKTGAGTVTFTQVELRTVGGTVDVQAGELVLGYGTRWENAALAVAAGATLRLGGTQGNTWHEVAGTLSGTPAGDVFLGGTDASGPGLVGVGAAAVALGGTGLQIVGSGLGGRFTGTVYEAAPSNRGLLRFVGAGDNRIDGAFVNEAAGTVRWEGPGRLLYSFVASLANAGLFELAPAADAGFFAAGVNGLRPGPFVNTGTFRKTGAATVTTNVEFDHVGATVDVRGGTLRTEWGGRFEDASVRVAEGAAYQLVVGGPPTVVAGTLAGMGGGAFVLRERMLIADSAGGRVAVGGAGLLVAYQGSLGGDPDGRGMRAAPVNGGLVRFVDIDGSVGGPFRNEGTVRWEAGTLRFAPGVTVTNAGVFDLDADGQTLQGGGIFAGATLANEAAGTVRKLGAGTTTLRAELVNGGRLAVAAGTLRVEHTGYNSFTNALGGLVSGTGTLDVSTLPPTLILNNGTTAPGPGDDGAGVGTLRWAGPYAPGAQARIVAEVGPGARGDRIEVAGAAALRAQLVVRVTGGYLPVVGESFEVLTASGGVTARFDTVSTVYSGGAVVFRPDYAVAGRVTLRAGAETPAPDLVVTPSPLVGGGRRLATVFGDGLVAGATATLACVACGDPVGHGRIVGDVVRASPGELDVRFDLTSPRAYGTYRLVVRAGGDSTAAPVEVVPYVSVPLVLQSGAAGIAIRPAPAFGTTAVNVYNATNAGEPAIFLVQFTPPHPAVRFTPMNVRLGPGEMEASGLLFVPVAPSLDTPAAISFRTAIAPADVRFPDEALDGGANIPFSSLQTVRAEAYGFVSPAQLAQALADIVLQAAAEVGVTVSEADAQRAGEAGVNAILNGDDDASRAGKTASIFGDIATSVGGVAGSTIKPLVPGLGAAIGDQLQGVVKGLLNATPGLVKVPTCEVQTQDPERTRAEIDLLQRQLELNQKMQEQLRRTDEGVGQRRGKTGAPQGCGGGGGGGGGAGGTPDTDEPLPQPIRAPLDPNDKAPGAPRGCEIVGTGADARCGRYLIPLAESAEPVTYTVRFENVATATAEAETVTITDTLDADFDPATFEVLASTADSVLTATVAGRVVTFTFTGINLPPNRTAPEGEGAVTYRVRPRAGLPDGTELRNRASIVFDFNPPIVTPEVVHAVRATADVGVVVAADTVGSVGVPLAYAFAVTNAALADPAEATTLKVPLPEGATLVGLATAAGACGEAAGAVTCAFGTLASGADATVTITLRPTQPGTLVLTATASSATSEATWYDAAATARTSVRGGTGAEAEGDVPAHVTLGSSAPNPFGLAATVRFGLPAAGRARLSMYDVLGREVAVLVDGDASAGWHAVRVDGAALAAGVYVLRLDAGGTSCTQTAVRVR